MSRVCVREIATRFPSGAPVVVLQELDTPWRCLALPITRAGALALLEAAAAAEALEPDARATSSEEPGAAPGHRLHSLHLSQVADGTRAVLVFTDPPEQVRDDLGPAGSARGDPPVGQSDDVQQIVDTAHRDSGPEDGLATAVREGVDIHADQSMFTHSAVQAETLDTVSAVEHPPTQELRRRQAQCLQDLLGAPAGGGLRHRVTSEEPPATPTVSAVADQSVVAELGGRPGGRIGTYEWDLDTDTWHWDATVYRLHGYPDRAVTPSTELVLSHQHRDDLVRVRELLARARIDGLPFTCRHRICSATGEVREIVTFGHATPGPVPEDTEVDDPPETGSGPGARRMAGYFVDLTATARPHASGALPVEGDHAAVVTPRSDVDRATGALMLAFGLDAAAAGGLLSRIAQREYLADHDLAQRLTRIATSIGVDDDTRHALGQALLGAGERPAGHRTAVAGA